MDTDVTTNSTRRLISSLTYISIHSIIRTIPTQSHITIKHVMSCHTTPPSIYHNWFDSIQPSTVINSWQWRPPPVITDNDTDGGIPSYLICIHICFYSVPYVYNSRLDYLKRELTKREGGRISIDQVCSHKQSNSFLGQRATLFNQGRLSSSLYRTKNLFSSDEQRCHCVIELLVFCWQSQSIFQHYNLYSKSF